MFRVILRGFFSRRLRAVLTGIAIALGVALMSGTYILTDTIDQSFASIFASGERNRDVVVVPHQALGATAAVQTGTIPAAVLAKVRAVPGVAVAGGEVFSQATLLDAQGKRLNTRAPSFVASTLPARFENFSAASGTLPRNGGDVAVDQATAQRAGLRPGELLRVAGASATGTYRISGIAKFAGSGSFGGAGVALLTLPQAQRLAGEKGAYDTLLVAATPGVSATALRARIRAVLPRSLDVRTGTQEAAQQTSDLEDQLGFLRTFLLIFAYVALFVGAFIIFNTFSITVAQRTREFGLLRTLGATRGQILASVVSEGILLGLLGSGIGLLAGLGLAPGLDQLFKSVFGADLPDSGTVLELRTVWVSLLAGTAVTVVAGLLPAIRASRVTPVAALREGVSLSEGRAPRSRRRRAIGLAIVGALIVLRVVLEASSGAGVITIVVIIAIVVAVRVPLVRRRIKRAWNALIVRLARVLAGLFAWRGITGRLARDNTIRHPGRTAVTAASLMIGLLLVSFVSILAAGLKASINQAIDASFAGNLIIENATNAQSTAGIPAEIPTALRAVRGVRQVTDIAFTEGRVKGLGGTQSITAVDPTNFAHVYRIDWDTGNDATITSLGTTGAVLTKTFASAHHYRVGQQLTVLTPSGGHVALTVRGIATDHAGLLADLTIGLPLARRAFSQRTDALDFVSYAPGANDAQVQPAVDRILAARFPQAKSQTAAQFKATEAAQVDSLLAFVYVLLALSVIVSLFGIVNTLVLSIYERTRELGMLRAIGTTRAQVREMIRYESVITALIGGVLGIVLGIVLALILSATALSGTGFVLVIPVPTMIVLFVLAGLAGLAAAAWPARRAASVDILAAIATQ
jgi:putative ABC transport system permease protein